MSDVERLMFDLRRIHSHWQTLYPTLFRQAVSVDYRRERLELPDGDFIDLDFAEVGSKRAVILCHGLESSAHAHYMLGMARALNESGLDAIAMNFRGCSGELNRLVRSYHSGETEDLKCVIRHALEVKHYSELSLVGFSLGGNVIIKYLGEEGDHADVLGAVAFSVPCDLGASARQLTVGFNKIYMRRFMKLLVEKIRSKNRLLKTGFDEKGFARMSSFAEFDGAYTAPVHGFESAENYWKQCSAKQFVPFVRRPTLLVNAANDPFLTAECYPVEEARLSPLFTLEIPNDGGHMGFISGSIHNTAYWHEGHAIRYLKNNVFL